MRAHFDDGRCCVSWTIHVDQLSMFLGLVRLSCERDGDDAGSDNCSVQVVLPVDIENWSAVVLICWCG